ncbi:hypothetical protein KC331_g169 [Hortaea werneckii]|nr:hypothetical protein KC361_g8398 [Hortaea werneckii]KAI6832692.1 hypothetical protein KC342_g7197 [Hortaea werneckii]KAI6849067.1 hypothetical protein KC350_g2757 [Hortaea werneckii]KAI7152858.1 hypothetical protein KC349_g8738 [Hortaea werneckii]KAI7554973.1 hypothetical protein KC331_g169 [Hortaea werneckii]
MHFPTIIAIQYLAIAAMAIYPFKGSNYGLLMNPLAPGAKVANDIYDNCKKLDEAGNVDSRPQKALKHLSLERSMSLVQQTNDKYMLSSSVIRRSTIRMESRFELTYMAVIVHSMCT